MTKLSSRRPGSNYSYVMTLTPAVAGSSTASAVVSFKSLIWKRGVHVAEVRESADRVALLQLDADQPVVLEGSAAAIWLLIDGVRTQSEILAQLVDTFGEADERIAMHVDNFLSQLAAQQLIEAVGKEFVEPDAHRGSTSNGG